MPSYLNKTNINILWILTHLSHTYIHTYIHTNAHRGAYAHTQYIYTSWLEVRNMITQDDRLGAVLDSLSCSESSSPRLAHTWNCVHSTPVGNTDL